MRHQEELIVDSFAGGGGASLGIKMAVGRCPDIAINHDLAAIQMHEANHPECQHFTEDVWKVSPTAVTKGRPVGLLWSSPDCKSFSRAKGAKPVEKNIRSLAWVVCKWAAECSPRVIVLENVREFAEWGPLLPQWQCECGWKGTEGQAILARTRRRCPRCNSLKIKVNYRTLIPDPARKGLTFKRFVGRLRNLGYRIERKNLDAADYGAPTHRRRLFLVARNDGEPIVWPEPTHCDPRKTSERDLFTGSRQPWRTAAECIDWSIPCPSIFERKRPLAEATMKRIALGIRRYVLENPKPYLVVCNHGGEEFRGQNLAEPLPTVTAARDAHGLVTPFVARCAHGENGRWGNGHQSLEEALPTLTGSKDFAIIAPILERPFGKSKCASVENPLPTTTAGGGGKQALLAPVLIQTGYGERDGQKPLALDIEKPMGTIVAGGCKQGLAVATLVGAGGAAYSGKPKPIDEPANTILPNDRRAVVAAWVIKHFGNGVVGVPADTPLPTTLSRGTQNQLAAATLVHMNHGEKQWSAVDEPMRTLTTGKHAALVYAFLTKYFGNAIGQHVTEPIHTVTGKDRFGLVTVTIEGETFVIVDIGMRMLRPRELARGQGFTDDYILTGTATSQVARIGNSVCPQIAAAIVSANFKPRKIKRKAATA